MSPSPPPKAIRSWQLAIFASLAAPLAAAGTPLAIYLPAYYANEAGLGLSLVGAIFMIGRLWDAFTDPLVGTLSDRTQSRFGRRKPWIAAGTLLFLIGAATVFAPAVLGVKPSGAWLFCWLFVFYLGWTMIQIPLLAWSGELAAQYDQRSRVQTYLQVAMATGLLLVLLLPTLLDQRAGPSGADAGLKVAVMGAVAAAILVPAVILSLIFVPEPARPALPRVKVPVIPALHHALADPLLLRILSSDFAVTLGQLIRSSLFVFFIAFYMGRPGLATALFLLQYSFGVFAGPIWLRVGYQIGKHRSAIAGELIQVAINLSLVLVTPDALPLLLGLTVAQGLAQGSGNLMLRSMVSDVADKHRLETGQETAGLLFSVFSVASKAATAVAIGVALPLVALLGFKPGIINSPQALLSLKLVFALGPALAHLISAALLFRFSLDRSGHDTIRRALEDQNAPLQLVSNPAE